MCMRICHLRTESVKGIDPWSRSALCQVGLEQIQPADITLTQLGAFILFSSKLLRS